MLLLLEFFASVNGNSHNSYPEQHTCIQDGLQSRGLSFLSIQRFLCKNAFFVTEVTYSVESIYVQQKTCFHLLSQFQTVIKHVCMHLVQSHSLISILVLLYFITTYMNFITVLCLLYFLYQSQCSYKNVVKLESIFGFDFCSDIRSVF